MKIAATDLGSNSIHLVIVEVSPSGGFQVVASEKEIETGEAPESRAPWPGPTPTCGGAA